MRFFHISDLHIGKQLNGADLIKDLRYELFDQVLGSAYEQFRPDGVTFGRVSFIVPGGTQGLTKDAWDGNIDHNTDLILLSYVKDGELYANKTIRQIKEHLGDLALVRTCYTYDDQPDGTLRLNLVFHMDDHSKLKPEDIVEARKVVRQVYLDEKIEQYIADIVFATRFPDRYGMKEMKDYISFGASPRASINLALAARAYAFIKRRGYVVPEDVRAVAHDVLRHRIGLSYEAEAMNVSADEIVSTILNSVEVP